MPFLFMLYCVTESTGIAEFLINITHALCTRVRILLKYNEFPYVFKTVSHPFVFYRNVSEVKRLFIGGATSLDTR